MIHPETARLVPDPATMLVACEAADGTHLGYLYVKGMCEELGLSPTILSHRNGELVTVPVWDGRPEVDGELLAHVLPEIANRYAELHDLPVELNQTPDDYA